MDKGFCAHLGVSDLSVHYSAIGDTISCDAPYGAIGLRGRLFLPPPPLQGLSLDCCDMPFLWKEVAV